MIRSAVDATLYSALSLSTSNLVDQNRPRSPKRTNSQKSALGAAEEGRPTPPPRTRSESALSTTSGSRSGGGNNNMSSQQHEAMDSVGGDEAAAFAVAAAAEEEKGGGGKKGSSNGQPKKKKVTIATSARTNSTEASSSRSFRLSGRFLPSKNTTNKGENKSTSSPVQSPEDDVVGDYDDGQYDEDGPASFHESSYSIEHQITKMGRKKSRAAAAASSNNNKKSKGGGNSYRFSLMAATDGLSKRHESWIRRAQESDISSDEEEEGGAGGEEDEEGFHRYRGDDKMFDSAIEEGEEASGDPSSSNRSPSQRSRNSASASGKGGAGAGGSGGGRSRGTGTTSRGTAKFNALYYTTEDDDVESSAAGSEIDDINTNSEVSAGRSRGSSIASRPKFFSWKYWWYGPRGYSVKGGSRVSRRSSRGKRCCSRPPEGGIMRVLCLLIMVGLVLAMVIILPLALINDGIGPFHRGGNTSLEAAATVSDTTEGVEEDEGEGPGQQWTTLPDPPSNLDALCSPDVIESEEGFYGCESRCAIALCCWIAPHNDTGTTVEEQRSYSSSSSSSSRTTALSVMETKLNEGGKGCYEDFPSVCDAYSPCRTIHGEFGSHPHNRPHPPHTDGVEGDKTQGPDGTDGGLPTEWPHEFDNTDDLFTLPLPGVDHDKDKDEEVLDGGSMTIGSGDPTEVSEGNDGGDGGVSSSTEPPPQPTTSNPKSDVGVVGDGDKNETGSGIQDGIVDYPEEDTSNNATTAAPTSTPKEEEEDDPDDEDISHRLDNITQTCSQDDLREAMIVGSANEEEGGGPNGQFLDCMKACYSSYHCCLSPLTYHPQHQGIPSDKNGSDTGGNFTQLIQEGWGKGDSCPGGGEGDVVGGEKNCTDMEGLICRDVFIFLEGLSHTNASMPLGVDIGNSGGNNGTKHDVAGDGLTPTYVFLPNPDGNEEDFLPPPNIFPPPDGLTSVQDLCSPSSLQEGDDNATAAAWEQCRAECIKRPCCLSTDETFSCLEKKDDEGTTDEEDMSWVESWCGDPTDPTSFVSTCRAANVSLNTEDIDDLLTLRDVCGVNDPPVMFGQAPFFPDAKWNCDHACDIRRPCCGTPADPAVSCINTFCTDYDEFCQDDSSGENGTTTTTNGVVGGGDDPQTSLTISNEEAQPRLRHRAHMDDR